MEIRLRDDDVVEERNVVAQAFLPKHIGEKKVFAVAEMLEGFVHITCYPGIDRVDKNSIAELIKELDEQTIIIDCVDNIPTRQFLWEQGVIHKIPVMHVGMSEKGSGYVQWNYADDKNSIDTFHLSPVNWNGKMPKEEKGQLPPCELSSMRTLILNTSMAAVNALFIFLGKDISNFATKEDAELTLTNWRTDLCELRTIPELEMELKL
jgi:hypothetical protein